MPAESTARRMKRLTDTYRRLRTAHITTVCSAPILRQYRTEIVRQIPSIIFRQIDKIDAGIQTHFKGFWCKMTAQSLRRHLAAPNLGNHGYHTPIPPPQAIKACFGLIFTELLIYCTKNLRLPRTKQYSMRKT